MAQDPTSELPAGWTQQPTPQATSFQQASSPAPATSASPSELPSGWTQQPTPRFSAPPGGSSSPATPYDATKPDDIYAAMEDPSYSNNFIPSQDQLRALYDAEKNRSFGDKVSGATGAAWDAVKGLGRGAANAVGEVLDPENWAQVPDAILNAGLNQTAGDYNLLRSASAKAYDLVRDIGASDEAKFNHYSQRVLNNLWAQRAMQRGGGAGPGNETSLGGVESMAGIPLSPIGLALGPVGKVIGAPVAGAAAKVLEHLPGAEDAAAAVARGAQKVGTGVEKVAGLPGEIVGNSAEALVGPEAAEAARKAMTTTAIASAAAGSGIGKGLGILKVAEKGGQGLQVAGQAAERLADTEGVSQFSRLQQIAKDPSAPQWMRTLASVGNKPVGKLAEGAAGLVSDTVKAGAHGAAVGGLLGAANGERPEDVGAGIGSGAALGAGLRIASDPIVRRQQLLQAKAADVARFYNKQAAFGLTPDYMAKHIGDATMLQAATLDKIFDGKLDIRFVDRATYHNLTGQLGSAGAFLDNGSTKQILIPAESVRGPQNSFLHEVGHALAASEVASDPQIKLAIDQALGNDPAKLDALKDQYAEKLAKAQRAQDGSVGDPEAPTLPEVSQAIKTRLDAKSAVEHGGDKNHWIYSELYAEHVVNALKGKDIYNIASPSLTGRAVDSLRKVLSSVGVPFKESGAPAGTPSDIFGGKAQAVIDSPELRRMTYDYIRRRNEFLSGLRKTRGDTVPVATVSREQIGKTEAAPLHTDSDPKGRKGNDYFYQTDDGSIHPRTPQAARELVKQRQAEVEAATDKIPPAAPDDKTLEVAPRRTISGLLQTTGQKLGKWFYDLKSYSPESKANAKLMEGAMQSGNVVGFWYHPAGTGRGAAYRESLRKAGGGLEVTQRRGIPFAFVVSKKGEVDVAGRKVKTGGNISVNMLDLASADKKAYEWQAQNKLDLWGGDVNSFQKDLKTYLQNHGKNLPGETEIGTAKRDKLNAFIIGKATKHIDKNALRAALQGDDKAGIVRSFRVDRIETAKPTGENIAPGHYDKKVLNLTPENEDAPRAQRNFQYSPDIESKQQRTPNEEIRQNADEYLTARGITPNPYTDQRQYPEDLAKKVADAYEAASHSPADEKVKEAYAALTQETRAQWDQISKAGIAMEPWTGEGQPYANSAEMRKDVAENKHLWFFPTEAGFGDGNIHNVNPMLALSGVKVGDRDLPFNDLFRAIHDVYGHAKEGYDFGPRGEYNAYLAHSRMFSDTARPAMAAETLGQNSWVNYGPHLRDESGNIPKKGEPGFVPPTERPYAEQKATILPEEIVQAATVSPKETNIQLSPDTSGDKNLDKKSIPGDVRKVDHAKDIGKTSETGQNVPPKTGRSAAQARISARLREADARRSPGSVVGPRTSGQKVILHHWSSVPDLTELDPSFHGTGIPGAERSRKRDYPEDYVDRVFFGTQGYEKEPALGPHHYVTTVDKSKLYDVSKDPDDLRPTPEEIEEAGHAPMDRNAAFTIFERKIRDAGYLGFINPYLKISALFQKTPVKYRKP